MKVEESDFDQTPAEMNIAIFKTTKICEENWIFTTLHVDRIGNDGTAKEVESW